MPYRITIQKGPTPGKTFELEKDVMVIGRDLKSDIPINDAEVSRSHAGLTRQGDNYLLEDLNSTNGTFVNGQRIRGSHTLTAGDVIGLGETIALEYSATVSETAATVVVSAPPQMEATLISATPPPMPEGMALDAESPLLPIGGEGQQPGGNRNMIIAIAIGVGVLVCCCCPSLIGGIYALVNSGLLGGG